MATLLKIHPLRESQNIRPKSGSEFTDESGAMSGPFRATQRWNNIIKHLQDNVHTKSYKTKAKRYDSCFSGADAVDVLLPYLQQGGFERDISRENAIKLCQLLLEQSIFEDALTTSQIPSNPKPSFQDNSTHFYRFKSNPSKTLRMSQRLSNLSRSEKRPSDDLGPTCSQFDRKKKWRSSFSAGMSKTDHRCNEDDASTGPTSHFDRKRKKRSSFGFGKLKADVFSRSEDGHQTETPSEKRKRKRSSFGLGRLKTDTYNVGGSVESIPQSTDKRRASFRIKHKMDSKCSDAGSQESLTLPERKRSRRSFGSFRLSNKRADARQRDTDTASLSSETSQQGTSRSRSASLMSQRTHCDSGEPADFKDELDVNEIWKESTVQRLLELVDLPLLEDILTCLDNFQKPDYSGGGRTDCSNGSQDEPKSDPWLSSALACLQSHPDCSAITASFLSATNSQSQSSVHARKLLLYQTLSGHYAGRGGPALLPAELGEVLAAVLDSVARGRSSRAVELAQMVLAMLEVGPREELRRLLQFMSLASAKTAVQLSYEMDNRVTLITAFTSFIVPAQAMSTTQARNLVSFMMDCFGHVDKIPARVAAKAQRRIKLLKSWQGDIYTDLHCVQITPQQYHQQRTAGTEAALRVLTNAIIDNTKMSLKEKKQHLQELKRHHPKLYAKHFANML